MNPSITVYLLILAIEWLSGQRHANDVAAFLPLQISITSTTCSSVDVDDDDDDDFSDDFRTDVLNSSQLQLTLSSTNQLQ